jgi:3',5'-cyclic AMP phosphodiesterase CpdA
MDPATSVVVLWRSDEETLATTLEYGEGTSTDQRADGITHMFQPSGGRPVRVHEVHLCGLRADTQYSYRVGGEGQDGSESWSQVYTFRTAPTAADAEVVIGVIGDTRSGYTIWEECLGVLGQVGPPDLILFNGDSVLIGTDRAEWDEFFDRSGSLLPYAPMLVAHGNHDLNSPNYYGQFALPGDEQNYGIDYGPVHLTVLNDSPDDEGDLAGRAVDFMQADLGAAAAAPWKIAMHHRPIWSACAFHGGDEALRALWGPIFDTHRVDLVLSGHDHNYERTKPMRGETPQATAADGTLYVVVGSAGAQLYDAGMGFWTEFSEKAYSVMILRVRAGMLAATAYRQDGTLLDQFMILK